MISQVDHYFDLALEHDDAGRLNEATEFYTKALELKPSHVESLINLSRIYASERCEPALGLPYARRAVMADPKHAVAWFNCGTIAQDMGILDDALMAYAKALALDSELSDAKWNLQDLLAKHF